MKPLRWIALLTLAPAVAAAEPRRLTLDQSLALARTGSPDLAISERSVTAAEEHLGSDRALRLPSLNLGANLQYWDQALALSFAGGATTLTVRDQLTTSTTLSLVEPLSGQLVIGSLLRGDRAGLAASKADHAGASLEVQAQVARAYLGVLLAGSAAEIADARQQQVAAQLERARALKAADVLQQVDVLRLEAAVAAAQRDAIGARSDVDSARDALAMLLGLAAGDEVEVVDDLPAAPKPPPLDLDQAVALALAHSPTLAAGHARAAQARAGADVARAPLFPNVNAIANYAHNTGSGPFQPEDAWFVGVTVDWKLWDWGHTWDSFHEADARAEQAERAADRAADRTRVAVRKAARDARAAFDALAVAASGRTAAEEAYRIQKARFDEGETTTTELLDADSGAAQARLGFATARQAYFVRIAELALAVGETPDALLERIK